MLTKFEIFKYFSKLSFQIVKQHPILIRFRAKTAFKTDQGIRDIIDNLN